MPAPALDEQIKKENRIVAGWLLFYHDRRREYLDQREGIIHSSGPCLSDVVPGGANITSDTTGRKGQKLADLEVTRQWLKLIADVESRLPADLKVFLRLRQEYRYCRGRKGWTASVQWRLADELNIEVETRQNLHTRWNRIVDITARMAAKRNLL
ncbi:MAG: hypothetical protein FH756_01620 [Firmicutes bacterium]|nr:hypothetical protein [Bacillota bacterium]